jgi:hypothetical protein
LWLLGEVSGKISAQWLIAHYYHRRRLYAVSHSGYRGTAPRRLEKDSAALRVLYELVVSPWPLLLWVNFRTAANDRTDHLQGFLDILRGPDDNLFARDEDDDSDLYRILVKADGRLGLYPSDWSQFMVEIDLRTWLQISNMTWIVSRPRHGSYENIKIRLVDGYSPTPISADNILAPLDIHFVVNNFPITSMARVAYYGERTALESRSGDFWSSMNLETWLSTRSRNICYAVWHNSALVSVVDRIKCMHLVLNALPQVSSFLPSPDLKDLNFKMNRTSRRMRII